jgi:hypothetical protein
MKNVKKSILLLVFTLMFMMSAKAQAFNGYGSRWFLGGTFGLSFGTVTSISIMPELAYSITEDFFVGGGVRYSYFQDNGVVPVYKSTVWGGKLFMRYYLFENIFAHIEAERLYFKDPFYTNPMGDSWIFRDYFYGGGGYRQWMGQNSYMTMELLFDLTNNDYSFGTNPIFRVGFGIGI